MFDKSAELNILVEDWLEKEPILTRHFYVWPEIDDLVGSPPRRLIYTAGDPATGARNVSYINPDGLWVMDPIVPADNQTNSIWVKLNHADPKFFDRLRAYLMHFV
jgi:hypothetical protein